MKMYIVYVDSRIIFIATLNEYLHMIINYRYLFYFSKTKRHR